MDQRVTRLTREEIRFALEIDLLLKEREPIQCDRCDGWTYDTTCLCSPGRPVDPVERLVAEKENVSEEDFERLWREASEA